MTRCDSCGQGTVFLSPQRDCLSCAMSDPLERAAIAAAGVTPERWQSTTPIGREVYRELAQAALTAAINVDELAQHIGHEHAAIVRDHLLGSAAP